MRSIVATTQACSVAKGDRPGGEQVATGAAFLDAVEERLGSGPYLGSQPAVSVADLAAFGELSFIVDSKLDGAEAILGRAKICAWMNRMRPLTTDSSRMMLTDVTVCDQLFVLRLDCWRG